MISLKPLTSFQVMLLLMTLQQIHTTEDGYLAYVKDGCFIKGEAMSCVKYKAIKIAKRTIFGDYTSNDTIRANSIISFVPLDEETVKAQVVEEDKEFLKNPRGFFSEWAELTKYIMKVIKDFFKVKGLKVTLPEGSRTIESEENDDARGRRKRLAVIIPLMTLLATMKIKMLLIPVLLAVIIIKKVILIAALLLPSLLNTLKACKHHHPMTHYSYLGGDSSDYNSDYSNSYSYSAGGGYGKDWASNKAYSLPKHRPSTPVYITAPGATA